MIRVLVIVSILLGTAAANGEEDLTRPFIGPGTGGPKDRPVWGHRDGIRIGLAPTPGPHGLVRIYAPYLEQPFPRMVNFISIEPMVHGKKGRGQSELESSRHRSSEQGLSFYASEDPEAYSTTDAFPAGTLDAGGRTLRLYLHTEPFANGAMPVIETIFHRDRPHTIEFRTLAHPDSAPLAECVLSATMGNYGLLRTLRIGHETAIAEELWADPSTPLDRLGFLPWKVFPPNLHSKVSGPRFTAVAVSDRNDPASTNYPDSVPEAWRYRGLPAMHVWESPEPATVAVNARRTYWGTGAEIPGGPSIENFELRAPFKPGRRLLFSIEPQPETP